MTVDTITRTDAPPALTRRPPGHWRCVFWLHPTLEMIDSEGRGCWQLPGNEWIGWRAHVSEEIADESGRKDEAEAARVFGPDRLRYLRAEYFPVDA